MTTVKNIYDYINSVAPFATQEEWDNAGHLIGDFRQEVKTCVMALDATKAVCAFAAEIGADLLLTHHPVIFGGLREIPADSAVYTLVHAGIAAICAHTNYDVAAGGINDNLAALLGLKNTYHIEDSFLVCGELEAEMSIDDFAAFVADTLHCAGIRYTDTEQPIQRVAVGGGACEEFAQAALAVSDCFLTGDMKYHSMLEIAETEKAVISAGHFETENAAFLMLKTSLEAMFPEVEFVEAPVQNPIKSL